MFRAPSLFRLLSLSLLAVLLVCGVALAEDPHWGRLYVVASNVSVRENPSDSALKVRVLKAGQKVRVDFQDGVWVAVFDPKESVRSELKAMGYARLSELKANGAVELAQANSIEVRKPAPSVKPEVLVDGRLEKSGKPAEKPDAKSATRSEGKPGGKADAKPAKGFGEIRLADRPPHRARQA